MPRADIPLGMEIAAPAAPSGVAAPTSSFELPKAVGAWAWSVQEAIQPPVATPDDVHRRHLVVGYGGDLRGVLSPSYKAVSGEMPPEVVGQKTSDRSACGSACRSTGWTQQQQLAACPTVQVAVEAIACV